MRKFFNFIFVLWIIYGQVFGIAHSIRYHTNFDTLVSILLPPWAWYRSVELFSHDENDVTNRTVHQDLEDICVFFYMGLDREVSRDEIQNKKREYIERVINYPEHRKLFLKDGSRLFIDYYHSVLNDHCSSIEHYSANGRLKWEITKQTKKYEKELVKKFDLDEEVEVIKEGLSAQQYYFEENFKAERTDPPNERFVDYLNKITSLFNSFYEKQITVHDSFFGEIVNYS